jgi:tetratricopeptide (TPR) repeat protein
MANLEALLNDLANFDAENDYDGLRRIREQIVALFPESPHAPEAQYKLGLDLLFRNRDVTGACECFKSAIKFKHPLWSAAARISYSLCLFHQGDQQKALLELRKVAYPDEPTPHSVTALTFLDALMDGVATKEEVERVRRDRASQLKKLIKKIGSDDPPARAYYLHLLGLDALRENKVTEARTYFDEALALGKDRIGADLFDAIGSSMPHK